MYARGPFGHNSGKEGGTLQERRKLVRRKADKELWQRICELEAIVDRRTVGASKDAKRNRRRAIRHNCKVGIQMLIGHAAGGSDDWSVDAIKIKGRLLDLSTGGASLFTKERMDTGQELRLAIELPDGPVVQTTAVVRWVKHVAEKGGYASGVQFGHVPGKEQKHIAKFLDELDATLGL